MPRRAPQISQELQRPEADPADEAARAVEDANSSWALVEACQAGDVAAFGELYERYHDVVYRYVLFRMGDRSFAEDVTQETFVRALRRISSVSYQGRDIGAWFVTIARNLIFDYVKSSRFRLEQTTSEIVELSPSTGGPEQQVLDMATNDELLASIAKLNSDQRECIQYRFLKGLSVAETAELMDRNEGRSRHCSTARCAASHSSSRTACGERVSRRNSRNARGCVDHCAERTTRCGERLEGRNLVRSRSLYRPARTDGATRADEQRETAVRTDGMPRAWDDGYPGDDGFDRAPAGALHRRSWRTRSRWPPLWTVRGVTSRPIRTPPPGCGHGCSRCWPRRASGSSPAGPRSATGSTASTRPTSPHRSARRSPTTSTGTRCPTAARPASTHRPRTTRPVAAAARVVAATCCRRTTRTTPSR